MLGLSHAPGLSQDNLRAPRWLVSNGATTVGPVPTDLLQRGYVGGRIPDDCQVREVAWGTWRPLHGIREIGSLKRHLASDTAGPLDLRAASARLPEGHDTGELLSWALQLAAQALDANAGLVHRYRSPVSQPVTSSAFGVPPQCLGEVLPASDPSYLLALSGKGLCGSPYQGLAQRIVAERLQHDAPLASVVMTPIIAAGRLVALLELGRTDHPFRADDATELAEFAAHLARRISH